MQPRVKTACHTVPTGRSEQPRPLSKTWRSLKALSTRSATRLPSPGTVGFQHSELNTLVIRSPSRPYSRWQVPGRVELLSPTGDWLQGEAIGSRTALLSGKTPASIHTVCNVRSF